MSDYRIRSSRVSPLLSEFIADPSRPKPEENVQFSSFYERNASI